MTWRSGVPDRGRDWLKSARWPASSAPSSGTAFPVSRNSRRQGRRHRRRRFLRLFPIGSWWIAVWCWHSIARRATCHWLDARRGARCRAASGLCGAGRHPALVVAALVASLSFIRHRANIRPAGARAPKFVRKPGRKTPPSPASENHEPPTRLKSASAASAPSARACGNTSRPIPCAGVAARRAARTRPGMAVRDLRSRAASRSPPSS
jgi:hypothetical protein